MKQSIRSIGLFVALGTAGCGPENDVGAQRAAAQKAAFQQNFQELVDRGKSAFEAKDYDGAAKHFEDAVRLRDDSETRALLDSAMRAREAQRRAAYDRAMIRGVQARKEGNYPAAVAAFRDALAQISDKGEAAAELREAEYRNYCERGRTALAAERYADAVSALGEAVQRRPDDGESRELLKRSQALRRVQALALGKDALQSRKYAEAANLFAEAKNLAADAEVTGLLDEANFREALRLARQHFEVKRYPAAVLELERAKRLRPDDAEVRNLLGRATDARKRQDQEDYERAVKAGDDAISRKDYDAAITAYTEAATKQVPISNAAAKLAQARSEKAKKDSYARHISSGKTHLLVRNYRLAESEFLAASADVPGDAEALRLLQEARRGKR